MDTVQILHHLTTQLYAAAAVASANNSKAHSRQGSVISTGTGTVTSNTTSSPADKQLPLPSTSRNQSQAPNQHISKTMPLHGSQLSSMETPSTSEALQAALLSLPSSSSSQQAHLSQFQQQTEGQDTKMRLPADEQSSTIRLPTPASIVRRQRSASAMEAELQALEGRISHLSNEYEIFTNDLNKQNEYHERKHRQIEHAMKLIEDDNHRLAALAQQNRHRLQQQQQQQQQRRNR